jgi:pimeloyl-ACP methyl ester carboxylesterase
VLLHGGGANAFWWEHIAPSLADRFHVTALDFRGHGLSDYPDDVVPGAFTQDLEALVDHLGTREIILVGHSMGAHIALDHACRFPETRGLVLIDIARGASVRQRRRSRLALALRRSYPSPEEAIRRHRFLPPAPWVEPALRDAIVEKSIRREPDGRYSYSFDPRWFGIRSGTPPLLSRLQCPTLILRGAESEILTPEGAEQLLDELPGSDLRTIERAGHHVQLDQPAETIDALNRFLSDLAEGFPDDTGR